MNAETEEELAQHKERLKAMWASDDEVTAQEACFVLGAADKLVDRLVREVHKLSKPC